MNSFDVIEREITKYIVSETGIPITTNRNYDKVFRDMMYFNNLEQLNKRVVFTEVLRFFKKTLSGIKQEISHFDIIIKKDPCSLSDIIIIDFFIVSQIYSYNDNTIYRYNDTNIPRNYNFQNNYSYIDTYDSYFENKKVISSYKTLCEFSGHKYNKEIESYLSKNDFDYLIEYVEELKFFSKQEIINVLIKIDKEYSNNKKTVYKQTYEGLYGTY